MKSKRHTRRTNNINEMRGELHKLIELEQLDSDIVQEKSRELDTLILTYYRQEEEDQALKEP